MASYIALLRKDLDSDYGVEFPDFPGCVTAGATLEEARRRAAEALAGHIEIMAKDGDPIPAPRSLDAIVDEADTEGALPFLVTVADPKPRAVRINITVAADLLAQIDAFASERGMNRSSFLARAAKKAMNARA